MGLGIGIVAFDRRDPRTGGGERQHQRRPDGGQTDEMDLVAKQALAEEEGDDERSSRQRRDDPDVLEEPRRDFVRGCSFGSEHCEDTSKNLRVSL
ncbi:MAG: hypothetical protein R2710_09530 [Acidimicrobiales bacterium]